MNIFSSISIHPVWKKVDERPLTPDEREQFVCAVVEDDKYGPIVHFKGSWDPEDTYTPLSSESFSDVVVGQVLPKDSIRVITLTNDEEEFIYRIKYVES